MSTPTPKPEPITRESAEAIVSAIRAAHPLYLADGERGPVLFGHEHEQLPAGGWSIAWEGGSPEDWAREFCDLVFLGKATVPAGVHLEPIFSFVLGLYPA